MKTDDVTTEKAAKLLELTVVNAYKHGESDGESRMKAVADYYRDRLAERESEDE